MVSAGGVDGGLGWISLLRMSHHHQAFHLPLPHQGAYSLAHDAIWPLSWLQGSRETHCKPVLTCSTLSTNDSLWSPYSALPSCAIGNRIIPCNGGGHQDDESLLGSWPLPIPKGTWGGKIADPLANSSMHHWCTEGLSAWPRPLGFHRSQSLESWHMWPSPGRDQRSCEIPLGQK